MKRKTVGAQWLHFRLQALLGVAKLDPDAVWLLLTAKLPAKPDKNPNSKLLPEAKMLLKPKCGQPDEVHQGSTRATIKVMLKQVEALSVPWHK